MTDSVDDPNLTEVLREITDARAEQIFTGFPARVISFDPEKRTIVARPAVQVPVRKRDGSIAFTQLPDIQDVRVVYPSSRGFQLTFPLQPDDFVFCSIAMYDIGEWKRLGGDGVEPGDPRPHTLAGAVAFPGCYPDAELDGVDPANLVLGGQNASVVVTPSQVRLGSATASKGVGRVGDQVQVTIPTGSFLVAASAGVLNPAPVTVSGTITAGSAKVLADD